jgi:phosphatidylglycerol:prolipoprotein diacylglycerol transferase
MLEALIPYIEMPSKTLADLPLIGPLKLQVFGPLVAVGVIFGMNRVLAYAKHKDIDELIARDLMFWILVFGFTISHWVSVIFYSPETVVENPLVLVMIWNGLSSVGGVLGAFIGLIWYLRKMKQPLLIYSDALVFGFVVGFTFGRLGCSLVHDHPGAFVEDLPAYLTWLEPLAVGPWPGSQGRYRLDLGLLEFIYDLGIVLFVHFVYGWRKDRRPGQLAGLVAFLYAPMRFLLDFGRGAQDPRYFGLTTAHYASLAIFAAGVYLLFLRKERAEDRTWARDSDRIARERAAAGPAPSSDKPAE